MTIKPNKRIMRSLKLGEISAVDIPANEHATAPIMKSMGAPLAKARQDYAKALDQVKKAEAIFEREVARVAEVRRISKNAAYGVATSESALAQEAYALADQARIHAELMADRVATLESA